MFNFLKYSVIGLLTPEERLFNKNLQARKDAELNYRKTRDSMVLRVWFLEQLKEWNFFDNSKEYTGTIWKEDDLFNFKNYSWGTELTLFYNTAYIIIYSQLFEKLGEEKLKEFKINWQIPINKYNQVKTDGELYRFYHWFQEGFTIQEIIDCMIKFKDLNYKEYKNAPTSSLIGSDFSIADFENIKQMAKKVTTDPDPIFDLEVSGEELIKQMEEYYSPIDRYADLQLYEGVRRDKFKEEYLGPLYEAYDEQMKLSEEFKKNPVAKQLYEQNQLLKKQIGIEEKEPIFDFSSKQKKK